MGMKKNFTILIKLMLPVMVAFFMGTNVSEGQSVVYDLANQQSEFSIVRHYSDYIDITYSSYLSNERCFCYIDRYNTEYYKADVDLDLRVVDFRIYDDYVYFCGRYRNVPVIGWFKINDLFFSGADINLVSMPINLQTDLFRVPGYDVKIEGYRLKVFEANGDLHLVMVGMGTHRYDNKEATDSSDRDTYTKYSAIIDMWTNGYVVWKMRYTMDYDDDMSYDDLAVTDNYVVVTAHFKNPNHNYLGPQILYYSKPTSSGQSILNPTSWPNPIYAPGYWTDYDYIHCKNGTPFLITEVQNDRFITVCDAMIENIQPATVVTYYNNPVSWPVARYKYDPGVYAGTYNEIMYNSSNKFLYLLRPREYFIERLGSPYVYAEIIKMGSPDYYCLSMDMLERTGTVIVSGFDTTDTKMLWKLDESILNNCVSINSVSVYNEDEYRAYEPKEQYVQSELFLGERLRVTVKKMIMEITCE